MVGFSAEMALTLSVNDCLVDTVGEVGDLNSIPSLMADLGFKLVVFYLEVVEP